MGSTEMDLARQFVERYAARDTEGLAAICDPEVEARFMTSAGVHAERRAGGARAGRLVGERP